REDSWVAYVLFLRNRKQLLRSVYVHVVFWKFLIFGRGKKCKNASDEIIWRTPCSTSADPLGVADPRLKTSALTHTCSNTHVLLHTHALTHTLMLTHTCSYTHMLLHTHALTHTCSKTHTCCNTHMLYCNTHML